MSTLEAQLETVRSRLQVGQDLCSAVPCFHRGFAAEGSRLAAAVDKAAERWQRWPAWSCHAVFENSGRLPRVTVESTETNVHEPLERPEYCVQRGKREGTESCLVRSNGLIIGGQEHRYCDVNRCSESKAQREGRVEAQAEADRGPRNRM